MKKGFAVKIAVAVVCSHLIAAAVMVILSVFGSNLNSTQKLPTYFAFAALGIGAVVCGLISRKTGVGIAGALASGLLFSSVPALVSFFLGGESAYSVWMRLGVLLTAALVSPLVSLIPRKSQKKSFSASKRRDAVNKYIARR